MPEQSLREVNEDDAVNYRNLSLDDLLTQLQHYGRGVRKEALLGLMDLFKKHSARLFPCRASLCKKRTAKGEDRESRASSSAVDADAKSSENLTAFVNASLPLLQDEETSVRTTLLQLWENLFVVVRPVG
jgi:hypothetical protein